MQINSNYVVVEKLQEPEQEGFKTVEVQDNFVYKGMIKYLPDQPVYMSNQQLKIGDIVLFAKYSPDTHEQELDSVKVKFVNTNDLLAVL